MVIIQKFLIKLFFHKQHFVVRLSSPSYDLLGEGSCKISGAFILWNKFIYAIC